MTRSGNRDIVDLLHADHLETRSMLTRIAVGGAADRWQAFTVLADRVIRHEVAEEVVVYPALLGRRGGAAVSDSRLEDQVRIEDLLIRLERQPFESVAFQKQSVHLGLAILGHLDKEEAQVLPLLATKLTSRRRGQLGRRFLEIKGAVPTRRPEATAAVPTGPAIVDPTSALAIFLRDTAAYSDLAS